MIDQDPSITPYQIHWFTILHVKGIHKIPRVLYHFERQLGQAIQTTSPPIYHPTTHLCTITLITSLSAAGGISQAVFETLYLAQAAGKGWTFKGPTRNGWQNKGPVESLHHASYEWSFSGQAKKPSIIGINQIALSLARIRNTA